MSDNNAVLFERRGRAGWLTINRAAKRNSLNAAVVAGILAGLEQSAKDPEIRAIVLTGAGEKAFCAGADLSGGTGTFGSGFAEPAQPFADLLRAAHACRRPIVARVNGACMAGGMGLLGMCDMAVAADHANFGLPEVKLGVFPMQVLSVLQSLIARRDLMELCITGEPVDAATALRMRLVIYAVPPAELDEKTGWLLSRIVDKSPTAIRRGKHAIAAIADMTFEQALSFTEAQIGIAAMTEAAAEGIAAFIERRSPVWTGR